MLSRPFRCFPALPALACTALLLTACDSTPLSGGGAGDTDSSPAAIALLAPFQGIYDLQDDWNGQSPDEAYLVIGAPGLDGIAPASLYDFDEDNNCVPQRPFSGEVSKDLLGTRVFMDGILFFDQAILSLSRPTLTTLTIEFNDDFDTNNDGSTLDRISVTASRLGISQVNDLGSRC